MGCRELQATGNECLKRANLEIPVHDSQYKLLLTRDMKQYTEHLKN
jgi:hypothetical protein